MTVFLAPDCSEPVTKLNAYQCLPINWGLPTALKPNALASPAPVSWVYPQNGSGLAAAIVVSTHTTPAVPSLLRVAYTYSLPVCWSRYMPGWPEVEKVLWDSSVMIRG